jgi:transposase
MSSERRTYSRDFKQEAVRLYETSGKSAREIEQDLDITPGMLQKWRARLRQEGEQAFPGKGHQAEADTELRRLKRELEITRQERDILKKAIEVFSRDRR